VPPQGHSRVLRDLPPLVFVACAFVSARAAQDPASSRRTLAWLCVCLAAYVAIRYGGAASSRVRRSVAVIAACLAAGISAYFIAQYRFLAVEGKIPILDALGLAISGSIPRVGNWSPFSNTVATWLEGLLLFAAGASFDAESRPSRVLLASLTIVIGLATTLTTSRGAWLGVAGGAALWLIVRRTPRRKRGVVFAAGLCAALALSLLPVMRFGIALIDGFGASMGGAFVRPDRLDIYRNSLPLLDDLGVAGLGPGEQFALPFARFALLIQVPYVTYPHQLALHLWLAYGLAGMASWIWWMCSLAGVVAAAESGSVPARFRGAAAGIVATLLHGMTDARQAVDPWTWVPVFLLAGYVGAYAVAANRAPTRRTDILAALAAGAFLFGAWMRMAPVRAAVETRAGMLQELRASQEIGHGEGPGWRANAASRYERATMLDPRRAGPRRRLALIEADRGRFAAAFAHVRVALEQEPESLATRKAAGLIATWAGHVDLGRELLATVPGSVSELETWAVWWQSRNEPEASRNSIGVARDLATAGAR
jgi:O-antigen ligase